MPTARVLCPILLCLALAGCVEERVVSISGGLTSLPGAKNNYGPGVRAGRKPSTNIEQMLSLYQQQIGEDVSSSEKEPLRLVDGDGNITLVSRSPRHVLYHLGRTLDKDETELLYEQVLSDELKQIGRASCRERV